MYLEVVGTGPAGEEHADPQVRSTIAAGGRTHLGDASHPWRMARVGGSAPASASGRYRRGTQVWLSMGGRL
jgi:hypothetical protein